MKYFFTIIAFAIVILLPTSALAEYYWLPEIMVGQTTVEVGNETYYGGMTGNEAVVNSNVNTIQSGLTGFNESILLGTASNRSSCYLMNLAGISECFSITPTNSIMDVMTSKTYVNGTPKLHLATLVSPSKVISGDVYSEGYSFEEFDFYGRNLYESSDGDSSGSNATWTQSNYILNPDAQASYTEEQQTYFDQRIAELSGEATFEPSYTTRLRRSSIWRLDSKDIVTDSTLDRRLHPEGKVWRVGGELRLSRDRYEYRGKGTIIVEGDLRIENGVELVPKNPETDSLGIIVKGAVIFEGNNTVRAAVFSTRRANFNSTNIEFIGSLVAKNFRFRNRDSVGIYYDYNLENNWPPGFRYFSMPHPTEGEN